MTQWLETPLTIQNAANIQTKSLGHLDVREGKGVIIILKCTYDARNTTDRFHCSGLAGLLTTAL